MNCSCFSSVKRLGHGMNVVERVLENNCRILAISEVQFGLMPEKATIYFEKHARRVL